MNLPETRPSVTTKFKVENWEGYLIVSFYDNDQPGELFIHVAKEGTSISGLCDAVAALTSMMLQGGFAWKDIREKFAFTRFEPMDENYSSLLDCVAKKVSKVISERGGIEDLNCEKK